ncbi:MAG TPA: pyridoxamine 5'-phosphate oxidase family protein [Bacillota bacterium]|nr:pyridoxamine 5'-phosphate oxidase family protein [Bacillota bacterium]
MEIEYSLIKAEVVELLNQNKKWVLATAANNRVTARTMSIVNDGLKIYFQTDQDFIKFQQIRVNPNVALCFSNVQLEGMATIQGHPFNPANEWFIHEYQKHHPSAFKRYAHLQSEVVIEVIPNFITLWKYIDSLPCRDFLWVSEHRARREYINLNN